MWLKKSYLLSIFALFAVFFCSCIITSSDVSASEVFSVDLNTSSIYRKYLCSSSNNQNTPLCSNVTYLYLHNFSSYQSSFGGTMTVTCYNGQSNYNALQVYPYESVYDISFYISSYSCQDLYFTSSMNINTSSDFTASLYDSFPSFCPACPTCPEIPVNPYDDKLDSIRNAIILVPAVCLLLYFFYIIFGIIIPTTGGKK